MTILMIICYDDDSTTHMTQQKFHDYGDTKSMKFNVNIGYNATLVDR